jgi:hypothetical protein
MSIQYVPLVNGAITILRNLSRSGLAKDVNEADFQSNLVDYPEILALYMNEAQPFVRKETNLGRPRMDILVYFYGASPFDIVECKGPDQPIIGADGRATKYLQAAIKQMSTVTNS